MVLWVFFLVLTAPAQNQRFYFQGSSQSFVHGTPGVDQDIIVFCVNGDGHKMWRRNYGGLFEEDSHRWVIVE